MWTACPSSPAAKTEKTESEQASCSKQKLVEFMISKLNILKPLKGESRGKVLVQFTIAPRRFNAGCRNTAGHRLWLRRSCFIGGNHNANWTPAMKDGKPVALKMTFLFYFQPAKRNGSTGEDKEEGSK